MEPKGKGFFISQLENCEKGSPELIADAASSIGLSHIIIKIAEGSSPLYKKSKNDEDRLSATAGALRARNISVWGWQQIYGNEPEVEAQAGILTAYQLPLDGYVVNAGSEFKLQDSAVKADIYMEALRSSLPDIPIALSSFRFPSQHGQFPWQAFLGKIDLVMPQVYWLKTHGNAGAQLRRSIQEYRALSPYLPICPTGPSFKEWGWVPYPEEIKDILDTAREMGLQAINFFNLDCARQPLMEDVWQAIKQYPWHVQPLKKGIAEEYINALNSRDIDQVLKLYHADAIYIYPGGTARGSRQFMRWYRRLFEKIIPDSRFTLLKAASEDGIITFYWQAKSANPNDFVFSKDIIQMDGETISTHYSIFSQKPFE